MALTLLALPDDISLDVLDLLSQHDLYNLALVSSRITGLAQRVLYRSVRLLITRPSKQDQFVANPSNLYKFTGLARRVLYRSVRLLITRPSKQDQFVANPSNLYKFTRLVDTLAQNPHLRLYISTLSIGVFDDRFEDYEKLLALTPRLLSLYLSSSLPHFQLSNLALPFLETLGLDFGKLAVTRSQEVEEENSHRIEIIARQFWAPYLRKLLIRGIVLSPEMSVLFPSDRHRTASITDLQFRNCSDFEVGCLSDMLLCIKTLERLTLEVFGPTEESGGDAPCTGMEPETIGHSICIHASTLVQLEIAGSDTTEFRGSLIDSLSGYSNLKLLAIPEPFLVMVQDEASTLVDVLPSSLEELQLQFPMGYGSEDENRATRIKRLEQVAAAKPVQFLALKRVVWWEQPTRSLEGKVVYGPLSDMDHLTTTFNKVGVKFEWCSTAFFECSPFGRKYDEHPWGNYRVPKVKKTKSLLDLERDKFIRSMKASGIIS
ncbi:hypothetical protein OIDMADRAFT_180863 [Oidiodendron maius Zn]|uniref:F-box domain-containing protein n=1 Tax=Oidiodendron maius (strain Zn) TaxID=913774 RepID=A0A0C3HEG0_OIDMZ|nr:hypothetical protein OIDMADRAFT_180863 [Oidiodendron maius Zn]